MVGAQRSEDREPGSVPFAMFALGAALGFLIPAVLAFRWTLARDWEYFSALSFFVRSVWLVDHRLPIHDPWLCGGLNVLANPQNRLFSPLVALDVALPASWANLAGLLVYAFAGQWGAYRLFQRFGVSARWALIGSFLWINSNWFGLHFAEGHVAYGSMQLLPWIFLATLALPDPRWLLTLAVLLALFLLDGGFYTFIFSLLLIATVIVIFRLRDIVGWAATPGRWLMAAVVFALVSLPKTLPVLFEHHGREPDLDHHAYTAAEVVRFLFFPLNQIRPNHEYACYIGLVLPAWLLARWWRDRPGGVAMRPSFGGMLPLVLAAAFWFFVASGWWPQINPWNAVFQKLPLLNNAHLQARTLLIFFLFLLLAVVRRADVADRRRPVAGAIVALAIAEALVAKSFPFVKQIELAKEQAAGFEVASMAVIRTTRETWPGKSQTPAFYREGGTSLKRCYEPGIDSAGLPIRSATDPLYQGEAYILPPAKGEAELLSYTPGRLRLAYRDIPASELAHVQVNTNDLGYWRVVDGAGRVVSSRSELLTIALPGNVDRGQAGVLELELRPPYVPWIIGAFVLGVAIACAWLLRLRS